MAAWAGSSRGHAFRDWVTGENSQSQGDKVMRRRFVLPYHANSTLVALLICLSASAQSSAGSGTIRGVVRIEPAGIRVRNAVVTIAELKRATLTDAQGSYELTGVPHGSYSVIAHLDRLPDAVKTVEVATDTATVDFQLTLAAITEQMTVTATGSSETTSMSYQPVTSVDALELIQRNPISIGEALQYQLGVANRSFGPGAGRPVIRGFDGDRVLVLQDGLRLGGIASQSGDEVEPLDVLSLDHVEVVKGPATLLYGSNAMGGVVNGISATDIYKPGLSGYASALGGTNNWQAGGSGGFQYGFRDFMIFANGGRQKTNDYNTPLGVVLNSFARTGNLNAGGGWFPSRGWLSFKYAYDRRRHGIPVEPDEIDFESLAERRHGYEIRGGLRDLPGFIRSGDFGLRYNAYRASEFEFESDENVTELDSIATNKNYNYRANFNHHRIGNLSGSLGFSGFTRNYVSIGEEAPAPRTRQNSIAVYGVERVDFERLGLQFGARVEQNRYKPDGDFRDRNFAGFAGSAGVRVPLWKSGVFVANYQHSFRAPALEELYNNGPHPGILLFDIGNQSLNAEHGDGVDLSLRHNAGRLRLEGNVYDYHLRNFVFPAFTGQTDEESHLPKANYIQGNSRYRGAEARVEARILATVSFTGKMDYVRAELTELARFSQPLPRIPPLRGSLGVNWSYKAWSAQPEAILVRRQDRVFDNETPTSGYALFNVRGSYTFAAGRSAHIISLNAYNLGNSLYRNHLSFLKSVAPEMGRTVRLIYTLRF